MSDHTDTNLDARRGVVQAITAVMADLPGIGKSDRSPEGYAYRGIEAITKQLQPLLARHGVVIVPSARVEQIVPSPAMKDGWTDVHMTVDWRIYGPDGSSIDATTAGIGRDRADKGANKAMTQAYKYLLLDLLCVADKADDSDGHDYTADSRTEPPARRGHVDEPTREELVAKAKARATFERLKQLAGTDTAASVRELATNEGHKLTLTELGAYPAWRQQVDDLLSALLHEHPVDEHPVDDAPPPPAQVDPTTGEVLE